MQVETKKRFLFGQFEFEPQTGELRKNGRPIKLQAQPAMALALLLSRPGECVTRHEIQHHVWGESFVEFDQGLNYCISQIRAALGDKAEAPVFIETLPRQGYRFIAPVTQSPKSNGTEVLQTTNSVERPSSRMRQPLMIAALVVMAIGIAAVARLLWRSPAKTVSATQVKLAVLPFENISSDPEQEYFSDGLTEELITTLSQLDPKQLGVIARTSAMRYKGQRKAVDQIARELGVEYLLEGSVRSQGGQARIAVQLIRASDQSHLWAQSYDRPLEDLLEVQREVAQAVAANLPLALLPGDQFGLDNATTKPEVREPYLKARYLLGKRTHEATEKAIVLLQSAIAADSTYAPAYTCLAQAYLNQTGALAERVAKAKQSLQTAERLDDSRAETHLLLGYVALFGEWDWVAAKRHIERAIALEPGRALSYHAYAAYLSTLGRHAEAIAQLHKAQELDPVSPAVLGDIGWIYYAAGRYEDAIKQSQAILELEPDETFAHECLLQSYLRQGKEAEALSRARQIMKLRGATPEQVEAIEQGSAGDSLREYWRWNLSWLGARAGRDYIDPCYYALNYLDLGEKEKAFEYLEKAYNERSEMLVYVDIEPRYEALRSDPRFTELRQRVRTAE